MKDYKAAVYIGRFQPFHNGHLEVVRHGLEIAEKVIIVVGSINAAPNIKNPWSFEERKEMIEQSLADHLFGTPRVVVVGVRDYHYNMNTWVAEVQARTSPYIQEGESIALLGQYKDSSSYYLKHFPQWEFVPAATKNDFNIEATGIRTRLLREDFMGDWEGKVPEGYRGFIDQNIDTLAVPDTVRARLKAWIRTPEYANLCKEFKYIADYKRSWEGSPFPPTFVTVDAIVVCSGHVLVIKRKINPGKGLYALPGGFIRENEKIERAMLRELKEETGIRVDSLILESSIVASKVFDHPDRSLRGRTISHGYYLKLKDGRLPEVKGGDDAASAEWIPLMDVAKNERRFFDDHSHMITYFLNYT